jgi:hypothetical protein
LRHIPLRLAGESEMENVETENFGGGRGADVLGKIQRRKKFCFDVA